jgi:hypothetical protein
MEPQSTRQTGDEMRNVKWLMLAVLVAMTAACAGPYQRPYGYNYNGWTQRSAYGDRDHDGIPNRYDRDANGNGVPDRYEGK